MGVERTTVKSRSYVGACELGMDIYDGIKVMWYLPLSLLDVALARHRETRKRIWIDPIAGVGKVVKSP